VFAPKKIIEESFELRFIECGHRIRSSIPARSNRADNASSSDFGAGAAPGRTRFPDASVVPVPGTCPACQDSKAEPPP
jgi:hypothetical protein